MINDKETQNLLNRFNLWRQDHINQRQFILMLSLVVGVLTAFAAIRLKYYCVEVCSVI